MGKNKLYWGILLVVAFAAYLLGTTQNNLPLQKIVSSPSPFPSVTLAQKQQCLDDANKLVSTLNQSADKQWQTAHQYHTGYTSFTLKKSAYSTKLNTCVAEIYQYILQDQTTLQTDFVYDTLTDKILAQIAYPDDKYNFISNFKLDHYPLSSDLLEYEYSIGL